MIFNFKNTIITNNQKNGLNKNKKILVKHKMI
jgi:hypothetical protein